MGNVMESKYAEWLEELIEFVMECEPERIGVCAIMPDGGTMTSYFGECGHMDKALMGYTMNLDAIFDVTKANAKEILDAAEEGEDDDE